MSGPCIHLGDQIGERQRETCRRTVRLKVYDCHHPNHEDTTLQDCKRCVDFQAAEDQGFVTNWSVGVTTAPRPVPTLERCLKSLAVAGWSDPHIFAEPEAVIPDGFEDLVVSRRPVTMGAFPNWYLSLTEMVMANPHADAYLLCQDDILLSAGLRQYLDGRLWPAAEVGVVSLYCPRHYTNEDVNGFHEIHEGSGTWGALAYLFPNPSVRALLADPLFTDHRHHGRRQGLRNIDSITGLWCQERGLPYFVHSPSLIQHIGDTSTLWQANNTGRRRAKVFAADAAALESVMDKES